MLAAPSGQRLGRYRLTAMIARGGMGEVWAAQLTAAAGFCKPLVIKRIRPDHAGDWDLLRRFLGEARLAASLSHPNLATVYELGEADGEYFIAMEYLRGASVAELRAGGAVSPRDVAGILAEAAAGLDHLHELRDDAGAPAGFIHRDLSAANLMVTAPGVVKILDFGIAKPERAEASSASGARGTISYMAPEQLAGAELDRRVDVWALGVIGWELCTGARLFGGSPAECIDGIRAGAVPDLAARGVPAALAAVIHGCLTRDPAARPSSAAAVRRALLETGAVASGDELAALVRARSGAAMTARDRLFAIDEPATAPLGRGGDATARALARDDAPTELEAPARPRPGRRAATLAVGAAVIAAAGWFGWSRGAGRREETSPTPTPAPAPETLAAPTPAAPAPSAPRPAAATTTPTVSPPSSTDAARSARLTVTADAPVTIRVLGPGGDLTLGPTPLDDAALVPGMYVLYATADDGRSCVKTVIVDAGRQTREALRLPATAAASPGDC